MAKYLLLLMTLTMLILISGCIGNNGASVQGDTNNTTNQINPAGSPQSLIPTALDKYYATTPSEYLTKMYELSESMQAIRIAIDQKANKTVLNDAIKDFSQKYNESSNLVPEWMDYYDIDTLPKLQADNTSQILENLDSIFSSCTDCHREIKPAVWAKYHWKDFRNFTMNSSNGEIPWSSGKILLEEGLDGISVNIEEGNKDKIMDSFNLFKTMYNNMIEICNSCHQENNLKYIDTQNIDSLGNDLLSDNFNGAENIRQQIISNCYTCHIIHEGPQRIKELEEVR